MTRSRQRTRKVSKGKAVQINRTNRRLLHELWPKLVAAPVGSSASLIDYYIRTRGDGFTPGERALLEKVQQDLREAHEKLMMIYFRLKK